VVRRAAQGPAQVLERSALDLPHALAAQAERRTGLAQREHRAVFEAESMLEHRAVERRETDDRGAHEARRLAVEERGLRIDRSAIGDPGRARLVRAVRRVIVETECARRASLRRGIERREDRLADPPCRVGRELRAARRIEPSRGLEQTEVALGHELVERDAAMPIRAGDPHDEAQVVADEVCGVDLHSVLLRGTTDPDSRAFGRRDANVPVSEQPPSRFTPL